MELGKKVSFDNHWWVIYKLIILVSIIVFTVAQAYYYFVFINQERYYNRTEAKRYECKQDVQNLMVQYNSVASNFDQTKPEDQQMLYNYAVSLGIIDASGNPLDIKDLIKKCLPGQL